MTKTANNREFRKKTFVEIYAQTKAKVRKIEKTPAQKFVDDVAEITKKTPLTVRQWLYGAQVPDKLTQSVLADYFGSTPEQLFPTNNKTK